MTIKLFSICALIAASLFSHNASSAAAGNVKKAPVKEYCGSPLTLGSEKTFMHWDCSKIIVGSIGELEKIVQKTHVAPDGIKNDTDKYYESDSPAYSVWMFFGRDKAVRFRQLREDGSWSGIGVTVFCSGTRAACIAFGNKVINTPVPMQFFFKLGPPPPEPPPVIIDE